MPDQQLVVAAGETAQDEAWRSLEVIWIECPIPCDEETTSIGRKVRANSVSNRAAVVRAQAWTKGVTQEEVVGPEEDIVSTDVRITVTRDLRTVVHANHGLPTDTIGDEEHGPVVLGHAIDVILIEEDRPAELIQDRRDFGRDLPGFRVYPQERVASCIRNPQTGLAQEDAVNAFVRRGRCNVIELTEGERPARLS